MGFTLPIPPDTAIITDDASLKGAALVDTITGVIIGYVDNAEDFLTGAESGIVMIDGTICGPNNYNGSGDGIVEIYDANLIKIANTVLGTPPNADPTNIATDRVSYFYVVVKGIANALTLYKIDKAAVTIDSWNLGISSANNPFPCAVTRDNLFLYVQTFPTISKFDLTTSGMTADVIAVPNGVTWIGTDIDDNIFVYTFTDAPDFTPVIRKYNSSYSLLGEVNAGPVGYHADTAHLSSDDLYLFSWTQISSGIAHPSGYSVLRKIKLSDLSIISDTPPIPTENGSSFIDQGTDISNSCPLMISGIPSTIGEGKEECIGGSLAGQDGSDNSSGDCISCDPTSAPAINDGGWTAFSSQIVAAGATNCWNIGILAAIESWLAGIGKSLQRNSAGMIRGRIYEGYPVEIADYNKYADTNGPGCGWKISNHGLTF